MRARVASGTDGVSDLLSTSDTAACETPAASAMSFWVGREFARSPPPPPRDVRVDAIIPFRYTYYQNNINRDDPAFDQKGGAAMPVTRRQIVAATPAAAVAASLPRTPAAAEERK